MVKLMDDVITLYDVDLVQLKRKGYIIADTDNKSIKIMVVKLN